ncbi:hypothetical protein LTZ17_02025 [Lacticaseibacillus casei]|uniref:hypothetical protein n=1 Tax=Lacticaseibacillus casei TaxID=1582 RepID=UPI00237E34F1|nr:hypothetical protein [Lacticaseibacillus casei]MDE3281475.1 hypothetical protein [Lacticaseibacillus casei]
MNDMVLSLNDTIILNWLHEKGRGTVEEVRIVQLGNSLVLTLPENKGFKKGQSWLLIPEDDVKPSYTLIPKLEDPYIGKRRGSMYVPEE